MALSPGAVSISPVDSAALTATPRSMPTVSPLPGPAIPSGIKVNATCQRPARSTVMRYDFASGGTGRDQRKRTHPALGTRTSPTWRDRRRTSRGLSASTRNPSFRPAFPPRRAVMGAAEAVRRGLGEVAQCLLLHHLGAGCQPRVLRPHLGKLPALLQVTGSAVPARAPVPVLLDREVPHEPGLGAMVPQHHLLGGRGEQTVPGHTNTLAKATDISGEVKRRFLPGLKAGVSMPRSS